MPASSSHWASSGLELPQVDDGLAAAQEVGLEEQLVDLAGSHVVDQRAGQFLGRRHLAVRRLGGIADEGDAVALTVLISEIEADHAAQAEGLRTLVLDRERNPQVLAIFGFGV